MNPAYYHWFIVWSILLFGAALSVWKRKLTSLAAAGAVVVGLGVYVGCGYTGLAMLAVFFALATLATAHRRTLKAQLTAKPKHQERRKLGQVMANGGVPAALGVLSCLFPAHSPMFNLMLAGAVASATADTLSSELGMVYGRNTFNILTGKREPAGLDGVISIEGTLLGLAGAVVIALIYMTTVGSNIQVIVVILAGVIGNLADSVIGAAWERKRYLGNDAVNILNTLIAALAAFVIYWFL